MSPRSKTPPPPEMPKGYRQTRRASKSLKSAKRAELQHKVVTGASRAGRGTRNVLIVVLQGIALVAFTMLVLLFLATAINQFVRWNAQRQLADATPASERARQERENVLIIGADGDGAAGFIAMRVDRERGQVFGLAFPEGAFMDVPGRGFERLGEAYPEGVDAVASAVSNFLSVPIRSYIVVPSAVYRDVMKRQVVQGLPEQQSATNLSEDELKTLSAQLAQIPQKKVALLPMPVKPLKLGPQTYFEPQREEIGDLLKSWWGVDSAEQSSTTRAIVYNGAGKPGIAGEAAQQLIRSGVRVVDTQNADSFKYEDTLIVVKRGTLARGQEIRKALGVGKVSVEPSSEDITDVVIIIGKDYEPPKAAK